LTALHLRIPGWVWLMGIKTIAYYVTAHGFGHGVRSTDIIRAIHGIRPEQNVIIVSQLPESFFRNRIPRGSFAYRQASFDIGMVQLDSIRVDVAATLEQARNLCERRTKLLDHEAAFIKECGVGMIVADIPAIPLEAAADAGIPGIAVGNFSWDWIYSAYQDQDARWSAIARAFTEGYERAELLLRLPFHAEMDVFPRVQDVPLVASPGRHRREEISELTGARPDFTWILLSFTSLDWDDSALEAVEKIVGCEFFTVLPLEWKRRNVHPINRAIIPFSDVLASSDAVISKPGYGILSECVANRKPLIYTERTDFVEYPILEAAARRYLKHLHIPSDSLYRGDLQGALDEIGKVPEPPDCLPLGGDSIAARRLLDFL
jgi:hypothetical protein